MYFLKRQIKFCIRVLYASKLFPQFLFNFIFKSNHLHSASEGTVNEIKLLQRPSASLGKWYSNLPFASSLQQHLSLFAQDSQLTNVWFLKPLFTPKIHIKADQKQHITVLLTGFRAADFWGCWGWWTFAKMEYTPTHEESSKLSNPTPLIYQKEEKLCLFLSL